MANKKTPSGGAVNQKPAKKNLAAKKSAKRSPTKHVKAKSSNRADAAADAVDRQLARYQSMRDFAITAEPSGAGRKRKLPARGLPFCIQKHAASHLHYDFRLGWNGVLKSWAVAKGPSYFTGDKRLAVQVEDHPMEYGGFEGIIPAGQYGGGTVMLWDQGTWEPQAGHEDVDKGLREGSLKFVMHGTKIKGKWALIRMGGKAANERKPNWLLIKEHDDFERGKDDPCVTVEEPDSVVTGRTMDQIAQNEDHVWNSKDTAKGKAWYRQIGNGGSGGDGRNASPQLVKGREKGASFDKKRAMTVNAFEKSLGQLPKENQPGFVAPQLASQAISPPEGEGWLHELKLDGYRMQARKDGSGVQMLTRKGLDWTHRVRAVAKEVAKLAVDKVTLDGEVVVVAEDGTTSFADLQASFQDGAKNVLTYFCFDLLHVDGHNTRELPLKRRKEILGSVLSGADEELVRVSEHLETGGEELFRKACEFHAEGIVSKKASGRYSSGRGGDWVKMKCLHEQEFVVGGFTLPSNGIDGVGALLLGYYRDGKLIYAGRTGTGFNRKTHKSIREKLNRLVQVGVPFEQVPAEARRGVRWVKPELVVQVRFATWTADNLVRQAAFLGVREDKSAGEVVREEATVAPRPKSLKKKAGEQSVSTRAATHKVKGRVAAKEVAAMAHAPVRLTHPEKILDEQSGLTKQMLADYYWAVAKEMLPHIADRPLSLVRCPDGADKPCFYQKHASHALPDGVGSVDVADKNGKVEPYITLSTAEALAGLAQMGVLEVHPWGSRNKDLEHPDRLIFDLDPDEALGWDVLAGAAAEVRKRLKAIGLQSFLKTTGGKGLHVVVPIAPKLDWPAAKEFAHGFVSAMEKANPSLYLTKMTKAARKGKIYLDYLRNERGATSVAPFSPRARVGAPVSLPLKWSNLNLPARPVFSVATFGEWKSRLKADPWKAMATMKQHITADALASAAMKRSA